jgi:hypothetical protein
MTLNIVLPTTIKYNGKLVDNTTLRYGESVLRTIEPVHHKGVKIALGVFVICKTENALCEAGLPTLT